MQEIRKISTRTVFGEKDAILELVLSDKETEHKLFRIAGTCIGSRTGESDETDKPWVCLLGNFQAQSYSTGEVFQSGKAFVPMYVADRILGRLTGDVQSVTFCYDITAGYDSKSATSYVYGASPVAMPGAEPDPMEKLWRTLPPMEFESKKLPAPETDNKKKSA